MHLFGIRFNLANIWGLPMILGISAEFGLNVTFRYLEGRAYGAPALARPRVRTGPRRGAPAARWPDRASLRDWLRRATKSEVLRVVEHRDGLVSNLPLTPEQRSRRRLLDLVRKAEAAVR